MALFSSSNKNDQNQDQNQPQEPAISEDDLNKYLEQNPPSSKVMSQNQKPEELEEHPDDLSVSKPTSQAVDNIPVPPQNNQNPQNPTQQDLNLGPKTLPTSPVQTPPSQPTPNQPQAATPIPPANIQQQSMQDRVQSPPPTQGSGGGKIFAWVIIILIVLGGGAAAYWFYFATGTLALNITPPDATVKVADQTATGNNQLKLKAGDYEVIVEKQGYVTLKKNIKIEKFKTTTLQEILNKIPTMTKVVPGQVNDFYIIGDDIYYLANSGKTLFKMVSASESTSTPSDDTTDTPSQDTTTNNNDASTPSEDKTSTDNTSSPANSNADQSSRSELSLSPKAITPNTLVNIENVIFNPEENLAIIKVKQNKTALSNSPFINSRVANGKIMTYLYDFKRYDLVNQDSTFWGADIGDIVWSPDGQKVYYFLGPEGGEKTLVSASKNNQNIERIFNLAGDGIENPQISISPDGKSLTLVPRSSTYSKNFVYVFEIDTQKLTKVVLTGNNLGAKFSPDSTSVLYSTYSANQADPTKFSILSLVSIDGKSKKELNVQGFINQVDFSKDSKSLIYFKQNTPTEEIQISSLALEDKAETEFLYQPAITQVPSKIQFNINKNKCFFINSGFLYSLELINGENK